MFFIVDESKLTLYTKPFSIKNKAFIMVDKLKIKIIMSKYNERCVFSISLSGEKVAEALGGLGK